MRHADPRRGRVASSSSTSGGGGRGRLVDCGSGPHLISLYPSCGLLSARISCSVIFAGVQIPASLAPSTRSFSECASPSNYTIRLIVCARDTKRAAQCAQTHNTNIIQLIFQCDRKYGQHQSAINRISCLQAAKSLCGVVLFYLGVSTCV